MQVTLYFLTAINYYITSSFKIECNSFSTLWHLSAWGIHMIQLKSLHPSFFLFGSAGIVNADFPVLGRLGSWESYMFLCLAVAPTNLNLSELFIELVYIILRNLKTKFRQSPCSLLKSQLQYFMFIELFNQKLSPKVVFIFPSFIFTNVFL